MELFTLPAAEGIQIAIGATKAIVESAIAKAGPQLKSVVYMSSSSAIFDYPPECRVHTEADWSAGSEELIADADAMAKLEPFAKVGVAYAASKVGSEKAFWKIKEEKKPFFSMSAVQAR